MARSKSKEQKGKMSKDQVYFDPRRAADQQVEDIKAVIDEAVKEQEEKLSEKQANIEMGQKIVAGLGTLFISPSSLCLFGIFLFLDCLDFLC